MQAHPEVTLEAPRACCVVRFGANNRGQGCSASLAADRTSEPFFACQANLSQGSYEAAQYQGLLLGLVAALRNQAADVIVFGYVDSIIRAVRSAALNVKKGWWWEEVHASIWQHVCS